VCVVFDKGESDSLSLSRSPFPKQLLSPLSLPLEKHDGIELFLLSSPRGKKSKRNL
jgi:hypothetical protein